MDNYKTIKVTCSGSSDIPFRMKLIAEAGEISSARRPYKAPKWIEFLLILSLMSSISGFSRITGYNAGFEARAKYEAQLVPIHAISSSTPQILPKTGVLGVASWYDYNPEGYDDRRPGHEYSKSNDTCATRGWNRDGWMKVTNVDNGRSVSCRVNDHGPMSCEDRYKYKLDEPGKCVERTIDLSSHAFRQIASIDSGLINVSIEELQVISSPHK